MPNTKTIEIESIDAAVLEELLVSLTAKRREMLDFYEQDVRGGQESADDNADDFADRANNSYNRELMFSLSDNDRQALIRIEEAFKRFEDRTYGCCINCEASIGLPRLKALPWARHCIDCQELEEKGLLDG